MASPPSNFPHSLFTKHSPPYPANSQLPLQNTQRRQSEMSSSTPGGAKKRKMSMLSATSGTSNHPLRQTSFPPVGEFAGTPRSPSVDTMSLASASVAGGPKKRRGRKGKNQAGDDESVVDGKAKSAVSGTSEGQKRRQSNATVEDDDDDDEGGNDMALATVTRTEEEERKEAAHRAMLVAALDPEQYDRYSVYRSVKLPDATVRRIVNQTLSQSVPPNVILAIKSVAKIYAGDVIEEARRVQAQWNYTDDALKENIASKLHNMNPPASTMAEEVLNEEKRLPIGPLLPDHLREAVRRLKLSGEHGMVGQLGLVNEQHQSGTERFASKAGGKRLFK